MYSTYVIKAKGKARNYVITEQADNPTAIVDLGLELEEVNASFMSMLKVDVEDLTGKTLHDLSYFDALVGRIDIAKVADGKEQFITETAMNDGVLHHTTWQLVPINIQGVCGSFVLSRLQNNNNNHPKRQRTTDIQTDLGKLYMRAPLGIVHTTIDGKILQANPTFCAMLGYTEKELLRLTIKDISAPITHDQPTAPTEQYTERKNKGSIELKKKYICKNGTQFWAKLWVEFFKTNETNDDAPKDYAIGIIENIQQQEISAKVLHDLSTMEQGSDDFLEKIVKKIGQSLEVPCATIIFFDDDTHTTARIKTAFINDCWETERNELLDTLPSNIVLKTGKPYFILDGFYDLHPNIYINTLYDAVGYAAVPIINKEKKVIGAISIIDTKPISEEKIIENVLQIYANAVRTYIKNTKTQAQYQLLAANIQDFITLHDHEGKIIYASESCYDTSGYTPQELIGTVPRQYVIESDLENYDLQYEKLITKKGNGYIQYQAYHKQTGKLIWVESVMKSFYDPELKTYRYAGSTRNITKQKAADDKIAQTQIQAKEVIDSIQDMGVLSLDLEYKYTAMNDYHRQFATFITGTEPQIGVSIFDYTSNDDLIIRTKQNIDRAFAGETHTVIDDFSNTNYQKIFETSFYPSYNSKGLIIGAIILGKDITKKVETERIIIQKEGEVTKLNTELETLFYRTSHEFRSPLTSIEALVDLIDIFPDEVHIHKANIRKSIIQLKSRTTNISRYAYNKQEPIKNSKIVFSDFVNKIIAGVSTKIYAEGKKMPVVHINAPDDFYNDAVRLENIIYCIGANAYKYAKPNDPDFEVHIYVSTTPTHAIITIKDNGQGIRPDLLPNIFDMFVRANEGSQGAGMGLFIVKETVNTLGGTIHAISKLNEGSEFVVKIPNMTA